MGKNALYIIAVILALFLLMTGGLMELLSTTPASVLSDDLSQLQSELGLNFSGTFGWCKPCEYIRISSPYGTRSDPFTGVTTSHSGVDLANAAGTPIYAAKSGTVITATYGSVFGYNVRIDHGDGFITLYGHMTEYVVTEGQSVSGGQLIGYMGSTGRSTGPHLHFTVYCNGSTVDPMDYISDEALATQLAGNVEGQVFLYLTQTMGLNNAAACGVLANIHEESNFNVSALGDNGTSYGLCQWHDYRTGLGRWTSLRNYCASNGLDYTTPEGQLEYIRYELETFYPNLLEALRTVPNSAQGAYDAGYMWCTVYERPADAQTRGNIRGNLAKDTYWNNYN